jgi:hypothetical protein
VINGLSVRLATIAERGPMKLFVSFAFIDIGVIERWQREVSQRNKTRGYSAILKSLEAQLREALASAR